MDYTSSNSWIRFFKVILLAFSAAFIYELLFPVMFSLIPDSVKLVWGKWHLSVQILVGAATGVGIMHFARCRIANIFRSNYLSFLWAVLLALLIQGGIHVGVDGASPDAVFQNVWLGAAALAIIILIHELLHRFFVVCLSHKSSDSNCEETSPNNGNVTDIPYKCRIGIDDLPEYLRQLAKIPISELLKWASRREAPVEQDGDLFWRKQIAERLAGKITSEIKTRATSIALLGDKGIGKSSVINMTVNNLSNNDNVISAQVSCWGFDNAVNTQEYILSKIIRVLGTKVDTLSLQGLPQDFVKAISDHHSWLDVLLSSFRQPTTPEEQLNKLQTILSATGLHVLLILEDADRDVEADSARDLQAFLNRIKALSNISFILATERNAEIDYIKNCEHVEEMLRLEPDMVAIAIDRLRQWMYFAHKDSVFFPHTDPDSCFAPDYGLHQSVREIYGMKNYPIGHALADIIHTPRELKIIIDRIHTSWQALKGEVDLDDLLIFTALRESTPEVLTFINDNRSDLAYLARPDSGSMLMPNIAKEENDKTLTQLRGAWRRVRDKIDADKLHAAVSLATVFYTEIAAVAEIKAEISMPFEVSIQRVKSHLFGRHDGFRSPTDYWQRLMREGVLDSEIKDQDVMRFVIETKYEEAALLKLSGLIYDSEEFARSFAYFAKCLEFEYVLQLFSAFCKYACKQQGVSANTETLPGMAHLYQLIDRYSVNLELGHNWIIESLPGHLTFAHQLFILWVAEEDSPAQIQQRQNNFGLQEFVTKLQSEIIARLKSDWSNNRHRIEDFVECLDPDNHYSLQKMILPYSGLGGSSEEKATILYNPDDWGWIADVIYISLKEKRHVPVVAPQVAMLLLECFGSIDQMRDGTYKFKERPNNFTDGVLKDKANESLAIMMNYFGNFDRNKDYKAWEQAEKIYEALAEIRKRYSG